jgi:hypothetical protein
MSGNYLKKTSESMWRKKRKRKRNRLFSSTLMKTTGGPTSFTNTRNAKKFSSSTSES